ncbi:MAG: ArsA family ATPase [Actinomycetia bacterium]|nr:ArsA family ATPase [Actinomycetes bacterium]
MNDRPVLICLGSGGVGKTTMAAAWGIEAASRGQRVVVLTIDPAQRLAAALGFEGPKGAGLGTGQSIGNEPVRIDGPWPGELWAAMLDPAATLDTLLAEHGRPEVVARLTSSPLLANIVGSMSGSSEYLAAERLHQLHHDPRLERVVIDTPPSRHALDFLDSPGRLTRFVDNRLYRAVFAPQRGVLRSLKSAAHLVFRMTARLVGADLVDDVVKLFKDLGQLDQGFRQRATETSALLASDACGYALITSPRYEPLREAAWIQEGLHERGHQLDIVVVNRLVPVGPRAPLGAELDGMPEALVENWTELAALASLEGALIDELRGQLAPELPMVLIEDQPGPVNDLDGVAELARMLGQLLASSAKASSASSTDSVTGTIRSKPVV